ncbi:MAG: division/cell wall cluster transcriptional repressor MraZ [Bacteroidales bacterium]|nr:division/cell wall cluster transcriptional repressor MraZ [Bacteroidales bacterium]
MQNFIGVYDCKLDTKGRIMVPSPLKKQLMPFAEKGFIVKRSPDSKCLELYTMTAWERQERMISKLNPYKKEHKDFIRRFYAGVKQIEMDPSGRMLLTKDLLTFSGINKELTMAAARDIIEIWDKTAYETVINDTTVDFELLAERVMGDIELDSEE